MKKLYFMMALFGAIMSGMTLSYASGSVNEHLLKRKKAKIEKDLRRFKRTIKADTPNGQRYIKLQKRAMELLQQYPYTIERIELEEELCAVKKRLRFFETTPEDSDDEINRNEFSDSGLDSDYEDFYRHNITDKVSRVLRRELEALKATIATTKPSDLEMKRMLIGICEQELWYKQQLKEATTSCERLIIRSEIAKCRNFKAEVKKSLSESSIA